MKHKDSDSYFFDEEQFHKQFKGKRTGHKHIPRMLREYPRTLRGRVTSITGEGIRVHTDQGIRLCYLKGIFKKEKGAAKNLIAVGDFVQIVPEENLIVHIEKRYSSLARKDISGKSQQLIAVNIDQVFITTSVVAPPLKPSLIDRYLISARKGGMSPVILVNKLDLLDENEKETLRYRSFLTSYEPLGIPILSLSAYDLTGIEALRALLQNKTSVFAGQSGVGKSSLLNIAFGFEQQTRELTQKTEKGSHTTTTAQLLSLPTGGFCVDTPGIRSFGIWDLKKSDLTSHFFEFLPFAAQCRYPNCSHLNEPFCKVQEALANHQISSMRFESYRTLMEELHGFDNRSKRTRTQ